MKFTEGNVLKLLTEHLQPKVRVDGGDIEFEGMEGNRIHIGAHADCASCPATAECLKWWCEKEFEKAFGRRCEVAIHKHLPYFKK